MKSRKSWKIEQGLLLVLWAAVAGFLLLMVIAAWPQYWRFIAAETTPLAWLESVLLVLTGAVTGSIAVVEAMIGRRRKVIMGWIIVSAAFAWLSLDERFALHERIRDRFLKPTGIKLLPWMEAGDWLIPLYAVCGLAAVWSIWRLIGVHNGARIFLIVGLIIAACAVGMDTIDIRSLDKGAERLLQSIEEGLETVAMTSFLSAFLCVWMKRIRELTSEARNEPSNG
ncbi:hypothetical protein [Cohnella cholangitidis]|uniref:Uncharacterized protein n=1 Tax=Cohnella cholangitidis TaxID=2598458 RepID=A0A7G5C199_9BACL|nr:hypothetical protein [Cohnella cholangitidis]QMV42983.1 hypothetical protein FPL14_18660 [Cohnella cholangitidis]